MNFRAMIPWSRTLAPWVVAAILLQAGLREVWPRQVRFALERALAARELRQVAPDPVSLGLRAKSLARDSAILAARISQLRSRTLPGADPGAELASRLVPQLAQDGWKLQKVKADAQAGWAVLDLGVESDFPGILRGLHRIRTAPWAMQVRRFSVRPGTQAGLQVDLQVAAPAGRMR